MKVVIKSSSIQLHSRNYINKQVNVHLRNCW